MVHVWSTRHRNRAVRNGRQRCIVAQVADVILGKQARAQNPDKDGLLPGTAAYGRQAARLDCSGHPERGAQAATSSDQRQRHPLGAPVSPGGPKPVGAPSRVTAESARTSPTPRPPNVVPSSYARFGVVCSPSVVEDGCCGGGFGGPRRRAPGLVGTRGPASSQPKDHPDPFGGRSFAIPERPATYGARIRVLAPARAALGRRVGCRPRPGPGPR